MYGKEIGSGTAVALTSLHLPGLGVKLGSHVTDPFQPVPGSDAASVSETETPYEARA